MRGTLFFRIFSSFSAVILFLSMLILLVTFASVRTHYIDDLRSHLFRIADVLALEAGRLITSRSDSYLGDFIRAVERQERLKITVVYHGELESYMDKPEFAMAVERGEGVVAQVQWEIERGAFVCGCSC